MNNFSESEIRDRIAFHQQQADLYQEMFNGPLPSEIVLRFDKNKAVGLKGLDSGSRELQTRLRAFIYEIVVHHVNARISWELALQGGAGSEQTVGKS